MQSMQIKYKKYLVLAAFLSAPLMQAAQAKTQRIRFARGAESKTVRGHSSQQKSDAFYLVKVRAAQKMSIKVSMAKPYKIETAVVPMLEITSPSGQLTTDKSRRFDTLDTEAGDYQIRVGVNQMATNGEAGDFDLKVWAR